MSYLGQLHFGIVADREMMPDVASLIGWLGEELDALKPPGKAAPRRATKLESNRAAKTRRKISR